MGIEVEEVLGSRFKVESARCNVQGSMSKVRSHKSKVQCSKKILTSGFREFSKRGTLRRDAGRLRRAGTSCLFRKPRSYFSRPGERLYEELVMDGEELAPPGHEKVLRLPNHRLDVVAFQQDLGALRHFVTAPDRAGAAGGFIGEKAAGESA